MSRLVNGWDVDVVVKRGGVTGEPVLTLTGIGKRVCDAVADAMTANPAKKIRNGDYLIVKVNWPTQFEEE